MSTDVFTYFCWHIWSAHSQIFDMDRNICHADPRRCGKYHLGLSVSQPLSKVLNLGHAGFHWSTDRLLQTLRGYFVQQWQDLLLYLKRTLDVILGSLAVNLAVLFVYCAISMNHSGIVFLLVHSELISPRSAVAYLYEFEFSTWCVNWTKSKKKTKLKNKFKHISVM